MTKAKTMLLLMKPINKEKIPYTDSFDRKDPNSIYEKMSDKGEVAEISEVKHIILESKYITSNWSRSQIQFIQSEFKLIEFNDCIKRKQNEVVDKENTMAYMTDELIDQDNSCLPSKNNVRYTQAKFMQTNKMSKGLMGIFFNNLDLASM